MAGGSVAIYVDYFRIAGMGAGFRIGPTMQRLSSADRGVCLRGVTGVWDLDQQAALYNVLPENFPFEPDSPPVDRVSDCVNNKTMFRQIHDKHEQQAFPDTPIHGKKLVNAPAFGGGQAIRSPCLWLLQKQMKDACAVMLQLPKYSAIATAPHLSSRPCPQWST